MKGSTPFSSYCFKFYGRKVFKITDVMNLSTGEILTYSCCPKQAVIAAYRYYTKHDANLVDPPLYYELPIFEGKLTIACGDWGTFKDGRGLNQ